jgi:hypothetical protein
MTMNGSSESHRRDRRRRTVRRVPAIGLALGPLLLLAAPLEAANNCSIQYSWTAGGSDQSTTLNVLAGQTVAVNQNSMRFVRNMGDTVVRLTLSGVPFPTINLAPAGRDPQVGSYLGAVTLVSAECATGTGSIQTITMPTCGGERVLYQGETRTDVWVEGLGVAGPGQQIVVSGSGVSAQIVESQLGRIRLRLIAASNAATGPRSVSITSPTFGPDQFDIVVHPKAVVSSSVGGPWEGSFQTNVDVTLQGQGLANLTGVNASINTGGGNPLIGANGSPLSVPPSVPATLLPGTNTATQAGIRLNFSQALQQATVQLNLFGDGAACSPMRVHSVNPRSPLVVNLPLAAQPFRENYVVEHRFNDTRREYRLGDVVTVDVRLATQQTQDAKLFWTVIPGTAVQQAGSVPYNPTAASNVLPAFAGQQNAVITFQVSQCTAPGTTNSVRFVTWKPDAGLDTSPNRKETTFTIRCLP